MLSNLFKIFILLLIFLGESLAILAEMLAARHYIHQPFWQAFSKVI